MSKTQASACVARAFHFDCLPQLEAVAKGFNNAHALFLCWQMSTRMSRYPGVLLTGSVPSQCC